MKPLDVNPPVIGSLGREVESFISCDDGFLDALFPRPDQDEHPPHPDHRVTYTKLVPRHEEVDGLHDVRRALGVEHLTDEGDH